MCLSIRTELVAVLIWTTAFGLSVSSAAQADGADPLEPGVVLRGPTTFQRAVQQGVEAITFDIRDAATNARARMRMMMNYANDSASVSSAIFRKLASGGQAAIRIADAAEIEPGTVLRSDLSADMMVCQTVLDSRDERDVLYVLRCVNEDSGKRPKSVSGGTLIEVDVFVTANSGSPTDTLLMRHALAQGAARYVYVRVER